jgi:trans-aconitate methyltransferase
VTPGELAALEERWRARGPAPDPDCTGFLPYPVEPFRRLLAAVRAHVTGTFCDLGAGIGTKVLIAAQLGYQATGIEIRQDYLAEATRIGADVRPGDVRTTEARGYDVVYLNHPLAGADAEAALERRVQAELSPGAVLITVNSPSPPPHGAHWRTLATVGDPPGWAVQKAG